MTPIKKYLFLTLCLFITTVSAQKKNQETLINKEFTHQYADKYASIAQAQLDAYNSRDINAFLENYSDDVEVYRFPNKLLYKGKEIMKKTYVRMFETTPNLHCKLVSRIVEQNVVIDKEKVQLKNGIIQATAIYVIKDNKIKKVYFIQ